MSRQIAFFRAVRGRAFEYDRNSHELCSAQVRAQSSFGFWRMRSSALLSCAACPQGTDRPLRSSEWHLTWIDGVVEPGLGLDGRPRDCVGATALAGSMRRLHRFQIVSWQDPFPSHLRSGTLGFVCSVPHPQETVELLATCGSAWLVSSSSVWTASSKKKCNFFEPKQTEKSM